MQNKWLAIFIVLVVLFAGGFYAFKTNLLGLASGTPQTGDEGVVCTMEAKLCPDGVTYVGRTGPHCEFSACPAATSTASSSSVVEASLNQKVEAQGVTIIPLEVVEDSRCLAGVYCIQAGTVRVKASIAGGLGLGLYNATLTLGKPLTTEAEIITLTEVAPLKTANHQILPSEYRFTFTITKR